MKRLLAVIILCVIGWTAHPVASQGIFENFTFYNDLVFENPLAIRADPSGSNWMFVVEQEGVVRTFLATYGVSEAPVVLDISDRVLGTDVSIESGLLGLDLHPQFEDNGYIYIYYLTDITGSSTARVSRFTTSGTPAVADLESELVLIELDRSDEKHNGGDVHFGPDGYLYVSFGDGACCGDPLENGQDPTNLFSTIIRIDVDNANNGLPYAIPQDNPFVGNTDGWREEIWAYGLRNPWRFSFHPDTGDIWVGDVGEITYEEVNRIIPGGNYGWNIMEGPDCFEWPPGSGQGTNCDQTGLIPPVWAYGRNIGVSVTGGIVYQGSRRPDLVGKYIFADWGVQKIWAATLDDQAQEIVSIDTLFSSSWPLPSAFGEDPSGELLFLAYFSGRIYRLSSSTATEPDPDIEETELVLWGPNPFREDTQLMLDVAESADIRIETFDRLGRRVGVLFEEQVPASTRVYIPFAGRFLASGTYILRLVVDGRPVNIVKVMRLR